MDFGRGAAPRVLGCIAPASVARWGRAHFFSGLVWGAAVLTLFPFLVLAFVNSPMADDFWYGTLVHKYGLLRSQVEWYHGWGGRYTSTAIISTYAWVTDLGGGLVLIPFITMLAIHVSIVLLIVSLADIVPRRAAWYAFVFLAVYVANMPRPASGLYWLAGVGVYQPGAVLFLLFSIGLLRLSKGLDGSTSRILLTTACCVLSVIVIGTNELAMLSILFLCSLMLASSIWRRHASRLPLGAVMLVSLAAAFVVISAPGNDVRSGESLFAWGQAVPALANSVFEGVQTLVAWSLNSTLLALTVLFLPISGAHRGDWNIGRMLPSPWLVPACWLLLLLMFFYPTQLAFGIAPPDRALNAIYLLFLVAWFSSILVIVQAKDAPRLAEIPIHLLRAAYIVLAVGLLCQGNVYTAVKDVVLRAPTHARQLEDRSRRISEARASGLSEVILPPLSAPPFSTWIWDIGENSAHWSNRYFAAFHGMESARVEGPGDSATETSIPDEWEVRALDFLR